MESWWVPCPVSMDTIAQEGSGSLDGLTWGKYHSSSDTLNLHPLLGSSGRSRPRCGRPLLKGDTGLRLQQLQAPVGGQVEASPRHRGQDSKDSRSVSRASLRTKPP